LIEGDGDDVGMVGIDPDGVVVVASGSAFDGGESLASVGGAVGGGVGDVDRVFIPGIDLDAAEVVAASVDTFFAVHLLPAFAGIVGAVDAAIFFSVNPGVHAVGIAGRDSGADAADALGFAGKAFGELMPGVAAVGGFVESAAGAVVAAADAPGRTARRPEAGEDDLRVAGIEDEVHASGVFIFVENFLEGLAAVEGAEDAALGVGAVGVSLSGDEEAVGIFGSTMMEAICWALRRAPSR